MLGPKEGMAVRLAITGGQDALEKGGLDDLMRRSLLKGTSQNHKCGRKNRVRDWAEEIKK